MASGGGIQVAEEGNRRVGSMNNPEVRQCVLDISTWFQRNSDMDPAPYPLEVGGGDCEATLTVP